MSRYGTPRIDPGESDEQIAARRKTMIARLEEFGPDAVKTLMATDGFPHHWGPVIREWLEAKDSSE